MTITKAALARQLVELGHPRSVNTLRGWTMERLQSEVTSILKTENLTQSQAGEGGGLSPTPIPQPSLQPSNTQPDTSPAPISEPVSKSIPVAELYTAEQARDCGCESCRTYLSVVEPEAQVYVPTDRELYVAALASRPVEVAVVKAERPQSWMSLAMWPVRVVCSLFVG